MIKSSSAPTSRTPTIQIPGGSGTVPNLSDNLPGTHDVRVATMELIIGRIVYQGFIYDTSYIQLCDCSNKELYILKKFRAKPDDCLRHHFIFNDVLSSDSILKEID